MISKHFPYLIEESGDIFTKPKKGLTPPEKKHSLQLFIPQLYLWAISYCAFIRSVPGPANGELSPAKGKGKVKSANSPGRPKNSAAKDSPKKTASPQKDLTKPMNKFGGKTEEELLQMVLPDHLDYDLDILIVSL